MTGPTPTEKQIEAFYDAHDASLECQPREHHQAVLEGLTAALAVEAGAMGVKPLEWREKGVDYFADTSVGQYCVGLVHTRFRAVLRAIVDGQWADIDVWSGGGVEAAKAAAQADYEARIRSALTTSPASSGVEGEAVAWQPIDTADKEAGRMLLGIVREGKLEEVHIGFYAFAYNEDEVDCWWSEQGDDEIVPTHWAPLFLPTSPAPQTEDRADG